MHFEYSPEDEAFRLEVRQFFKEQLPTGIQHRWQAGAHPPLREDIRVWQRILHQRGWGAPHWPVEHGGTGWSAFRDRKSTRLNSSHQHRSRMPSSA